MSEIICLKTLLGYHDIMNFIDGRITYCLRKTTPKDRWEGNERFILLEIKLLQKNKFFSMNCKEYIDFELQKEFHSFEGKGFLYPLDAMKGLL